MSDQEFQLHLLWRIADDVRALKVLAYIFAGLWVLGVVVIFVAAAADSG